MLVAQDLAATLVRVGYAEEALALDPANHRQRTTEALIRQIYKAQVAWDKDMNLVPRLAKSWTQDDPLTCEFRLRGGIKFHNGAEMTAEGARFTFERISTPGGLDALPASPSSRSSTRPTPVVR